VDKDVSERPSISTFKVEVNNIVTWRLEARLVEQEDVVIAERRSRIRRLAVLNCIVSSRYVATTSEQTEYFTCALVVVISDVIIYGYEL
jgi:hypothetical protein